MMVTAPAAAGAVSHDDGFDWASIDWRQAETAVRRLQARIVQACQAGRWGKVRALQHLLTHSFAAKVLAVRRVTENKGKRTPGVDGETWTTMEQKMAAVRNLRQRAPMGGRAQEPGRSQCCLVVGRIGDGRGPTRKRADVLVVFRHENI